MITRVANKAIRFSYVQNHKKPIQQMPKKIPPKYIYQIKYHPNSKPTLQHGYQDHIHWGDWETHGFSKFQLFQYQYTGQWWDNPGNKVISFFVLAFMIWGLYSVHTTSIENISKGRPHISNCRPIADVNYIGSFPSHDL